MRKEKIAITLDRQSIGELDRLVDERIFQSRSQAIQSAVDETLCRMKKTRLAEACAKLNPEQEKAMAEEGMLEDMKIWPEY